MATNESMEAPVNEFAEFDRVVTQIMDTFERLRVKTSTNRNVYNKNVYKPKCLQQKCLQTEMSTTKNVYKLKCLQQKRLQTEMSTNRNVYKAKRYNL